MSTTVLKPTKKLSRSYSSKQMAEPITSADSLRLKCLKIFTRAFNNEAFVASLISIVFSITYIIIIGYINPLILLNMYKVSQLIIFVIVLSGILYSFPFVGEAVSKFSVPTKITLGLVYLTAILTLCYVQDSWLRIYFGLAVLIGFLVKVVLFKDIVSPQWVLKIVEGEKNILNHLREDFPMFFKLLYFDNVVSASFIVTFAPFLREFFFTETRFIWLYMSWVISTWIIIRSVKLFVIQFANPQGWEKKAAKAFAVVGPVFTATAGGASYWLTSDIPGGRFQNYFQNFCNIDANSRSADKYVKKSLEYLYEETKNGALIPENVRDKSDSRVPDSRSIYVAAELVQEKNSKAPPHYVARALLEICVPKGTHPASVLLLPEVDLSHQSKFQKRSEFLVLCDKYDKEKTP